MYQIFLTQIAFQSPDRAELNFWGFAIKIALNFKFRGTEKSNFPPKGPTTFKFWEMKLLLLLIENMQNFQVFYVGYKVIGKSVKDDNILLQFWAFDWMNLNEYKGSFLFKSPSSSIHSFIPNPAKLEMFRYS